MPSDLLFAAAPGFDQPLAVLKHCHDRIRKQLATLQKLPEHLQKHGADHQAQTAALGILRYFVQAAPLHHEDEEHDLLPSLQASVSESERAQFELHLSKILEQHQLMATLWEQLKLMLTDISEAQNTIIDPVLIDAFTSLYAEHMAIEENHIAPLAAKSLSAEQFAIMGQHMRQRRGIQSA